MTTLPLSRSFRRRPGARAAVLAACVLAAGALAACGGGGSGAVLDLSAALPDTVPSGTVIRMGDPAIQAAVQASRLDKQLSAAGVKVQWANISGGPQSLQAFRGDKLDCSAVTDVPSLFAAWTGTSTRIIYQSVTVDPLRHPLYELAVAPGTTFTSLADLRGKKIAYSAGQAQGVLVLRLLQRAGLTQRDVHLVDLASTGDTYVTALGNRMVDVAALGVTNARIYQDKYPRGRVLPTGIRDDAATLYCLTKSVQNPGKAAALKVYADVRTKALLWENEHPAEYTKAYYEQSEGLSPTAAQTIMAAQGKIGIPASWDNAIARLQATADLVAAEQDQKKLDASTLFDRRFERFEAANAGPALVTGDAA